MISYRPMNITLATKEILKTKMAADVGISGPTLAKFAKGEPVNLSILEKICNYLDCDFKDLVEHRPDM